MSNPIVGRSQLLVDFMKNASVIDSVRIFDADKVTQLFPKGALIRVCGLFPENGVTEVQIVALGAARLFRHWVNDHANIIFGLEVNKKSDMDHLLTNGMNFRASIVVEDYTEADCRDGGKPISSIQVLQADYGQCQEMTQKTLTVFPAAITRLVQEYLLPCQSPGR